MKDTVKTIQEKGGLSNIENPVEEVIVPTAIEKIKDRNTYGIRNYVLNIKQGDAEKRPEIISSPVTYENLLKRLGFEKKVREYREEYEEFTGEEIEIDWTKIGTPITGHR